MKKLYSLNLKGQEKHWSFEIMADPKHVEDWREDGLEVDEICNTIPTWVPLLGPWAVRAWCFLQDVFHWKNPFQK